MAELKSGIVEKTVVTMPPSKRAADHKAIYANQVQISMTPFDMQLALIQSSAVGTEQISEILTTVFLSPPEAKLLAALLIRVVGDYEKQFGTIATPPG